MGVCGTYSGAHNEDKGHGEIGSTMHHPTERPSLTVAEEDELIKRVC